MKTRFGCNHLGSPRLLQGGWVDILHGAMKRPQEKSLLERVKERHKIAIERGVQADVELLADVIRFLASCNA